jgi:hypothetical protein
MGFKRYTVNIIKKLDGITNKKWWGFSRKQKHYAG